MRVKLLVALLAIISYTAFPAQAQAPEQDSHHVTLTKATDGTTPVVLLAQAPDPSGSDSESPQSPSATPSPVTLFFKENWAALIALFVGFVEAVLRLWPSQDDLSLVNRLIALLKSLLNTFVPNLKAGGGVH
jgi:hypothetical protein